MKCRKKNARKKKKKEIRCLLRIFFFINESIVILFIQGTRFPIDKIGIDITIYHQHNE